MPFLRRRNFQPFLLANIPGRLDFPSGTLLVDILAKKLILWGLFFRCKSNCRLGIRRSYGTQYPIFIFSTNQTSRCVESLAHFYIPSGCLVGRIYSKSRLTFRRNVSCRVGDNLICTLFTVSRHIIQRQIAQSFNTQCKPAFVNKKIGRMVCRRSFGVAALGHST